MGDGIIRTEKIFDAEVIAKSTATSTDAIDLGADRPIGDLSIQLELTGDGTATVSWTGSLDGTDYLVPNGDTGTIIAGFVKTSGPGGDGKHIYPFDMSIIRFIKITVTETGTANPVTVTATLAVQ
jgi:hypothetical protein